MKLTVSDIPEEGLEIDLNENLFLEGFSSEQLEVTAHIHVSREDQDIIIEGTLQTVIETECVRCLSALRNPLDNRFQVVYHPSLALKGDLELHKGDLETSFYTNDVIDLNEMLAEQIFLYSPVKPLCDEECKGLCAKCGVNLNMDTCNCERDETDSRWNALKNITFERKD